VSAVTQRDLFLSDQIGIEPQGGNPRVRDARRRVRDHHSSEQAYTNDLLTTDARAAHK
jgi:hypothetical protein